MKKFRTFVIGISTLLFVMTSLAQPREIVCSIKSSDGKGSITFYGNLSKDQDLAEWTKTQLAPTLAEWYSKIADILPNEQLSPPTNIDVIIENKMDPHDSGEVRRTRIEFGLKWAQVTDKNEVIGSLIEKMVHAIE